MPTAATPAQSAASRTNGARSRGPASAAGKARSARNATRHGLRGGPFALLPAEDHAEFAELHAAVTADWGPRDAYERRWVMELVTAYWRQDRLHGLELAALAAAADECPPSEATMRRLTTFARYGARIDRDIGKALQALRSLRNRPDAWIGAANGMAEPGPAAPPPDVTHAPASRTAEPEPAAVSAASAAPGPAPAPLSPHSRTLEPEPPLNRHQRRALAAMQRRRAA